MASILAQESASELSALLEQISPLLVQYVRENFEDDRLVCEVCSPEELKALFALDLPEQGVGIDGAIDVVKSALKYSVRTGHPRFMDKLYVGADPIGMVGELVTTALNTNLHIYSVAPVFTLMELAVIARLSEIFGMGQGTADGVSCPGGSYSNLLAMVTARNTLHPHTKQLGHRDGERLVVLTSADAHYSITKNAMLMGLGFDNIIKVPTTPDGCMIPAHLDEALKNAVAEGLTPFFVNATGGTTVQGGFDSFAQLAEIANRHKCWLHIDACWGGSVVFSDKHRHLMDGCGNADSIAWNAHKLMGLPIQSSILLVKQKGLLQRSNELGAGYLFHDDNEYDLGDKTLQCGRRPDIFKLFLSWRYHGTAGFGRRVDIAFENRDKFLALLASRSSEFRLVASPPFVNICFWYWPADMDEDTVGTLTKAIHGRMLRRGRVFVDYSPAPSGPAFFRIIINSPHITEQHLTQALDEIADLGRELQEQTIG